LIFLRSKYSSQHPVLEHPRAICPKIHPSHFANITNPTRNATYIWGQIYNVYYSFFLWTGTEELQLERLFENLVISGNSEGQTRKSVYYRCHTRRCDIFTDSDIRQLWLGLCPEPWH
jgi:hypothetical protein